MTGWRNRNIFITRLLIFTGFLMNIYKCITAFCVEDSNILFSNVLFVFWTFKYSQRVICIELWSRLSSQCILFLLLCCIFARQIDVETDVYTRRTSFKSNLPSSTAYSPLGSWGCLSLSQLSQVQMYTMYLSRYILDRSPVHHIETFTPTGNLE